MKILWQGKKTAINFVWSNTALSFVYFTRMANK